MWRENVIMLSKEFEKNREFWGKAVAQGNLIYPSEQVIRFIKRNENGRKHMKVLDFGCGAGRNAIALANEGYQVVAMDYNQNLLDIVEGKMNESAKLDIECIKNEGTSVPCKKNSFDRIVANGSLFFDSVDTVRDILKNLFEILKPGGLMWADFRGMDDSLYGMGEKINDYAVRMDGESGREGSTYVFFDRELLRKTYEDVGFEIISFDKSTYTEKNGLINNSWYYVVATKR